MRLHFSLYLFYTLRGVRFSAGYCIIAKSTQTGYPTQRNTFFTEGKHNEKSCIENETEGALGIVLADQHDRALEKSLQLPAVEQQLTLHKFRFLRHTGWPHPATRLPWRQSRLNCRHVKTRFVDSAAGGCRRRVRL